MVKVKTILPKNVKTMLDKSSNFDRHVPTILKSIYSKTILKSIVVQVCARSNGVEVIDS